MDQQNIDRLFREKMNQLEVRPSSDAWSQVEKQIRPKKTPVIYWVAASVSLLLISWIAWPETSSQNFTPLASEINHPVQPTTPEFIVPVVEDTEKSEDKPLKGMKKTQVQKQFAINSQEEPKNVIIDEVPVMEVESKTMVATEEIEEPKILDEVIEQVAQPEFRAVKITYIASSSDENGNKENIQKADSTTALKKFIAFAEKIDPGDMLADIKTAKDNLLNGGLKSKKDRNSL
jgi:hypothetical protein